jgi:magnesium chelatase accessory protein
MMANWDLDRLKAALPQVAVPVLLAHGSRDAAVPLASAEKAAALIRDCRFEILDGLGHLAHEEAPELATALIAQFARDCGIGT